MYTAVPYQKNAELMVSILALKTHDLLYDTDLK